MKVAGLYVRVGACPARGMLSLVLYVDVFCFLCSQRRFWAFSNAKLKLQEIFGLLRPSFLLLLRRSRFVGKEIQF